MVHLIKNLLAYPLFYLPLTLGGCSKNTSHLGMRKATQHNEHKAGTSRGEKHSAETNRNKEYLLELYRLLCDTGNNNFSAFKQFLDKHRSNIPINACISAQSERTTLLHTAVKKGYINYVKALLEFPGIDVNSRIDGRSPLYWAICNENCNIVDLLLKNRADLIVSDNQTALYLALETGRGITVDNRRRQVTDVVKRLLQEQSRVYDNTLEQLFKSEIASYHDIFQLLIDLDPNFVKYRDKDGNTPLHLACKYARPRRNSFNSGSSLLRSSTKVMDIRATVCLLIEKGADIHAINHQGRTLLHMCAKYGYPDESCIEEFLWVPKFNFDTLKKLLLQQDHKGNTPLHIACMGVGFIKPLNFISYARRICYTKDEYKRFINGPNHNGHTPLQLAIMNIRPFSTHYMRPNQDFIRSLVEAGADINTINKVPGERGGTLLHYLFFDDPYYDDVSNDTFKLLMADKQIDVTKRDKQGNTVLHLACEQRKPNFAQYFADYFLNHIPDLKHIPNAKPCTQPPYQDFINQPNRDGYTPLHLATKHCNIEVIKRLLKHKEYVNMDQDGPLPYDQGRSGIVNRTVFNEFGLTEEIRKSLKINCNKSVSSIGTPLYVAAKNNDQSIMELLIKEGAKLYPALKRAVTQQELVVLNRLNELLNMYTNTEDEEEKFKADLSKLLIAAKGTGHIEIENTVKDMLHKRNSR